MLFQETYERHLAEELSCEDPLCFTVDPFCRLLCARVCGLSAATENNLFSMHDWLRQCAKPGIALCSASNSSSYLKMVDSKEGRRKFENRSRFKRQKSTFW